MATQADVNSTLSAREQTHGSFIDNGEVMQELKKTCRSGARYHRLSNPQKEAVDMICHKLGRIVCGNSNFTDHWHDIAGYATLVENILNSETNI